MTPNIARINAALNAYDWTGGELATTRRRVAAYCAVGALLRYAGIPYRQIERGATLMTRWAVLARLLEREYGIPQDVLGQVMMRNDLSRSREEAAARVLDLLVGDRASALGAWERAILRRRRLPRIGGERPEPGPAGGAGRLRKAA